MANGTSQCINTCISNLITSRSWARWCEPQIGRQAKCSTQKTPYGSVIRNHVMSVPFMAAVAPTGSGQQGSHGADSVDRGLRHVAGTHSSSDDVSSGGSSTTRRLLMRCSGGRPSSEDEPPLPS